MEVSFVLISKRLMPKRTNGASQSAEHTGTIYVDPHGQTRPCLMSHKNNNLVCAEQAKR